MKIAVSENAYAESVGKSFHFHDEGGSMIRFGPYTILHDCFSMLELYQKYFEVSECLLKAPDRNHYVLLKHHRDTFKAEIERRINAHNPVKEV